MTLVVDTLIALAEGVAQQVEQLADPSLSIAWQSSGTYADGLIGIYMRTAPTAPDRTITFSPRLLTADPTQPESEYSLQIRYRGTIDVYTVWAVQSAVRDVILGRWPTVLPNGLAVRTVTYGGGTPLPQDTSQRHEATDNFVYGLAEHRAPRP